MRKAIVIGGSSGIGEALVRKLAERGWRVAAVARRIGPTSELKREFPDSVLPYQHDVRCYDEIPELFQLITRDLEGLDLFVYCAGVMPTVGPREYSFEKDREIAEVNFVGAMAWLDQAAIRFDGVGHGSIVAIGSVAGDRGRAAQPAYNAGKAGLATFMEALRNRLARKGVNVVTIKPGPVRTPMTEGLDLPGAMPVDKAADKSWRRSTRPASTISARYTG